MNQNDNIKLILKYLKERNCIESFLTLQKETGISYIPYSKEIQFFKKIMLKGDFTEAINFILTFQNRIDDRDLRKIVMDVYKQKLYELIQNPNQEQLKKIFQKEIINYCSEEQFQQLFSYLTYRSVNEIQGLQKWTVIKGRYQCFQTVIPYLQMFNSVLKNDQIQEKLQNIIEFYYSNVNNIKQVTFQPSKHNQIDYLKDTFQKNKSSLTQNKNQSSIDEELDRKNYEKKNRGSNQGNQKQKETIKNSIINMNLSGNYSQIKNKGTYNMPNQSMKPYANYEDQAQNNSEKSQLLVQKSQFLPQKVQIADKSSTFQKNPSNFNPSSVSDRRQRVNASLNGPMNRQKIEGSVKIDNFIKNDPPIQEPMQSSYKNQKFPQKMSASNQFNPQTPIQNPPNLSSYSQIAKSKRQNPSNYLNKQQNPVFLSHLNELESSQLNQISQEQQSEAAKSIKNQKPKESKQNYIFNSKNQDQQLEQQIKKNIQYLQQTSSVIYKTKEEFQKQNFTFSNRNEEKYTQKIKKVTKLAAISDSKAIRTCQFSQSGNYFAVGTNSSILKIFDVQKLFDRNRYQQIVPIYQIDSLHLKSIFCLDWSSNQRSLITCSNDLQIKLTQINKGFTEHKTSIIGKHDSCIRMVKFNSQQNRIVSCGDDSTIKVWDTGKVKRCTNLKNHTNSVSAIKLHNDNQIYSVSKDMTIKKWDLRINQNVATSKVQESELTYIANNTDKIIVSHKDGNVSFFNYGLQLQHSVQIHEEQIRSVQALRGQNMLLTASFDGHIALFTEKNSHNPNYFEHNETSEDKVVFATFLHSTQYRGFSSTSTLGLCHIYSYE